MLTQKESHNDDMSHTGGNQEPPVCHALVPQENACRKHSCGDKSDGLQQERVIPRLPQQRSETGHRKEIGTQEIKGPATVFSDSQESRSNGEERVEMT